MDGDLVNVQFGNRAVALPRGELNEAIILQAAGEPRSLKATISQLLVESVTELRNIADRPAVQLPDPQLPAQQPANDQPDSDDDDEDYDPEYGVNAGRMQDLYEEPEESDEEDDLLPRGRRHDNRRNRRNRRRSPGPGPRRRHREQQRNRNRNRPRNQRGAHSDSEGYSSDASTSSNSSYYSSSGASSNSNDSTFSEASYGNYKPRERNGLRHRSKGLNIGGVRINPGKFESDMKLAIRAGIEPENPESWEMYDNSEELRGEDMQLQRVMAPFLEVRASGEDRTKWRELVTSVAAMEVCMGAHTTLTKETFIPKEPIRKALTKVQRVAGFFEGNPAILFSNPYMAVNELVGKVKEKARSLQVSAMTARFRKELKVEFKMAWTVRVALLTLSDNQNGDDLIDEVRRCLAKEGAPTIDFKRIKSALRRIGRHDNIFADIEEAVAVIFEQAYVPKQSTNQHHNSKKQRGPGEVDRSAPHFFQASSSDQSQQGGSFRPNENQGKQQRRDGQHNSRQDGRSNHHGGNNNNNNNNQRGGHQNASSYRN